MYLIPDYTHIASHHLDCCTIAKEWFFMMDAVYSKVENSLLHLSWLYEIYSWGPNHHPFYWCDLFKNHTIDCGVFADLVQTILHHRGVECSRIQQYSLEHESQKYHWKEMWDSACVDYKNWIVDDTFVYHEFLVINMNGDAVFFDTSTGKIIDDKSPFVSRVVYMRRCQPMSIPVWYNTTLLKSTEWTSLSEFYAI